MHLEGRPDTPGARRLTSSEACGKGAVSVRWHTPGVELARKADGASLFGFTAPLLTTSEGKKMGKTADGAVWLNADLLSPFEYWQFWRNTAGALGLPLGRLASPRAVPSAPRRSLHVARPTPLAPRRSPHAARPTPLIPRRSPRATAVACRR